jgi:hypothetical protein
MTIARQIRAPQALHGLIRHLRNYYRQAQDNGWEMTVTIKIGSGDASTLVIRPQEQERLVG